MVSFFQVITVIRFRFFLGVQGHWYSAQCLLGMKLMGGEVCLPRIHNHAYTSELNRCMLRLIPRTHLSNYVEKINSVDEKWRCYCNLLYNDIVNEYVLQIEISFHVKTTYWLQKTY